MELQLGDQCVAISGTISPSAATSPIPKLFGTNAV